MSDSRSLGRNTVWNVAGKAAYIATWIYLTPRVLTRLGREPFGFWSLLMLLGASITFADLGLTAALTTYTAQLMTRDGRRQVASMLARSLMLYVLFALVVSAVGLALTPLALDTFHVAPAWRDQARLAYQLTFLAFGLATIGAVLQGVLVGLQRMDLTSGIGLVLTPLLILLVRFALDQPHPLPALIAVQIIHSLVTALALLVTLMVLLRPRAVSSGDEPRTPRLAEMFRFGTRVQLNVLSGFLHNQADKALLGARLGLAWVPPVELGLRVTNGLSSLPTLFLGALLPTFADHDARRGPSGRSDLYQRILEPYLMVVVPLGIGTVALAGPLMHAWMGEPRSDSSLALRLVMASSTLTLLAGVGTVAARAGGRPGLEARFGVTVLVLHVGLSLLLLRWLGWVGTLLGGIAAAAIGTAWFVSAVDRWLGLPPWRSAARTLARAVPAAALAAAVTLLVTHPLPATAGRAVALGWLLAGGVTFVLVYAGAMRVLAPAAWRGLLSRLLQLRPF